MTELTVRVESDVEDAFAELPQRMHGAVRGLGVEIQWHLVVHDVDGLVDDVAVFITHRTDAVSDPIDRQYSEPPQNRGDTRFLEDVGTRDEHLFLPRGLEQHEGVHQGVAVVGTEHDCAVGGDVLLAYYLDPRKAAAGMVVDCVFTN